ncbi:MAG: RagB/SusD family nutrient uptake outer membrane protein [Bacteroidales bacterium]|nr:RagB/SusD family nutrient uptake outer membrane protein [Bacteroidales bacterium]
MKKYIFTAFAAAALLTACVDLELSPKSQGSSENWYSSAQELELSLNGLYRPVLWYTECFRNHVTDRWSDDWSQRTNLYDWLGGAISDNWGEGAKHWANLYKGVARANTVIQGIEKAKGQLTDAEITQYTGEAKFFRASFYTYLITLFGDVPFYTEYISLDDAYKLGRIDRNVILEQIYSDFDDAAAALPVSYTGTQRITKGAALAMKARAALFMSDWATCAAAAKDCMDLGVYSLHPDYRELFLSSTKTSPEVIFALPALEGVAYAYQDNNGNSSGIRSFVPRNNGGTNVAQPSWDLFFAYICNDGLTVEESPLYDPANPYKNRDPRLSEITTPFDEEFMDYIYNPRASALRTPQVSTGKDSGIAAADYPGQVPSVGSNGNWWIGNKDTGISAAGTTTQQNCVGANGNWILGCTLAKNKDTLPGDSGNASYNGLMLKKGVDEEWIDRHTDTPMRIIRYADVLLMYAEAKMELNQIDNSVFDAINSIRARAWKCGVKETDKYPAVSETNQTALRRIIRNERRCELAWENRRWFDLIRWRVCEECLTTPIYGLPDMTVKMPANEASGYWLFPKDFRPHMRPSSTIDLSGLENFPDYYKINVRRAFVPRQYLFPIPADERVVCPMLTQNPGY